MPRGARLAGAGLLCLALALAWAATGLGEASLGAYGVRQTADGGIGHVFDEVTVVVPGDWAGQYLVMEYGDRAAFCQEASHRLWRQKDGREDGGLLFEVCVDETGPVPDSADCVLLGEGDQGVYTLRFPPASQAYAGDADAAQAYRALWDGLDYVRQNAYVHAFHAMPWPTAAAARASAFSEADAPYAGSWVTFEDGFKLYVPAAWRTLELTQAQREAGLFYLAGNGGRDEAAGDVAMGVGVGYVAAAGLRTLGELADDYRRSGCQAVESVNPNGLPAIRFERPGDGYRGAAFYHPSLEGYILTVYVSPLAETGTPAGRIAEALLRSLSPWPE